MFKFDLHIHSNNSDGSDCIDEIIVKAKDIDYIAISDHNTINGWKNWQEAMNQANKKGLLGIEISTVYNNREIHLLGYFALNSNVDHARFDCLRAMIKEYKLLKVRQMEMMITKLATIDNSINIDDFYECMRKRGKFGNYNRVHLANYLMDKGIINSVEEGFNYILKKGSPYYVEKRNLELSDGIKAIHQACGIAVIAHSIQYGFSDEELIDFISDCKKMGIDGFELFHPLMNDEFIRKLCQLLPEKELFTCGSDYHGSNGKNELGKGYCGDDEEIKALLQQSNYRMKMMIERLEILK